MQLDNFIALFENTQRTRWEQPAITDFKKESHTFGDVARQVECADLLWKAAGLGADDRIAFNAKSSAFTAIHFMAAVGKGYVAVQLFNGFTPNDTQMLVHHSDSRILYTEKKQFAGMDFEQMPSLVAAIDANTGELLASRGGFDQLYARRDALLAEKYPSGFGPQDVCLVHRGMEEVCAVMYTSGSTGNP